VAVSCHQDTLGSTRQSRQQKQHGLNNKLSRFASLTGAVGFSAAPDRAAGGMGDTRLEPVVLSGVLAHSKNSPPRSGNGSSPGTTPPPPSSGPRPPTRSSTRSAATAHGSHDQLTSPPLPLTIFRLRKLPGLNVQTSCTLKEPYVEFQARQMVTKGQKDSHREIYLLRQLSECLSH